MVSRKRQSVMKLASVSTLSDGLSDVPTGLVVVPVSCAWCTSGATFALTVVLTRSLTLPLGLRLTLDFIFTVTSATGFPLIRIPTIHDKRLW